tara:strand:- start:75 stop:449 length:375 start_codon:yes stop_codon:yes gene_type:complete
MSKYIPTDNKSNGQVKPKLKVKVLFDKEEKILNEYDAFAMLSDLNVRLSQHQKIIQDMAQAVNGIMDGMKAASEGVELDEKIKERTGTPVNYTNLKLPKLKTTQAGLDDGNKFYNSDGNVKLES